MEETKYLIVNYCVKSNWHKDEFITSIIGDYVEYSKNYFELFSYDDFVHYLQHDVKDFYGKIDYEKIIKIIQDIDGIIEDGCYILDNVVYSRDEIIDLFLKDDNFIKFVESERIENGELIFY